MSTSHIKSLSIAVESSFGSISPTTGDPDVSGLTFVSMECDRAPIITYGEPPVNERMEARAGPYNLPPEPDTSGTTPRRTGTFTIERVYPFIGTRSAFANIAAMPRHKLLNSVMKTTAAPSALGDTVSSGVSATEFEAGSVANYAEGIGVAVAIAGRGEYSFVTDVGASNIKVSPAFSDTLAGAEDMRICQTYCVANDLSGYGSSLAFIAQGVGWRTVMTGCRAESCAISREKNMIREVWTVRFAHAFDENGSASVANPVVADGNVAHMLDCYTVVTDATVNGVSAPAESGRDTIAVDDFSATLTWTLSPKGFSENITTMSDLEVTDFNAEINIIASSACSSLSQSTFYNKQMHGLVIPFGAVSVGNGGCMYLPAAALQNDPNVRDFGADAQRFIYNFKQGGPFTGDDSTTAPAGTCFRMATVN